MMKCQRIVKSARQHVGLSTRFARHSLIVYLALLCLLGVLLSADADASSLTAGNYLVVTSSVILEVDRVTGDREFVWPATGYEPATNYPGGIVIDSSWNVFFAGGTNGAVYRIDVDTGTRTVVSGDNNGSIIGSGPSLDRPWGIAFGPNGKLLVADSGLGAIVSIDPNTGNRTIVSGGPDDIGKGTDEFTPHDVLFTSTGELVAFERGANALVSIDLLTGDRNPIGSDPGFQLVDRLSEGAQGEVLASGSGAMFNASIFSIDLASGDSTLLVDPPRLMLPRDMLYDHLGNLLFLDTGLKPAIRRFDVDTEQFEILSAAGDPRRQQAPVVGDGPLLLSPRFIVRIPNRIPEPSSFCLAILAFGMTWHWSRCRKSIGRWRDRLY